MFLTLGGKDEKETMEMKKEGGAWTITRFGDEK